MLQLAGCGTRHLAACWHRAGQRNLGDIRVRDEKRSRIAVPLDHVEHTLRQARLNEYLSDLQRAERSDFRGLNTMALPAASAGAAFQQAICCG